MQLTLSEILLQSSKLGDVGKHGLYVENNGNGYSFVQNIINGFKILVTTNSRPFGMGYWVNSVPKSLLQK